MLQHQVFDLVLMDIHMPGMGGVEATRRAARLRRAQRERRWCALTANVLEEQLQAYRAAGMDSWTAKPSTLSTCPGDRRRPGAFHDATADNRAARPYPPRPCGR